MEGVAEVDRLNSASHSSPKRTALNSHSYRPTSAAICGLIFPIDFRDADLSSKVAEDYQMKSCEIPQRKSSG
jgi:hypothetical protein